LHEQAEFLDARFLDALDMIFVRTASLLMKISPVFRSTTSLQMIRPSELLEVDFPQVHFFHEAEELEDFVVGGIPEGAQQLVTGNFFFRSM